MWSLISVNCRALTKDDRNGLISFVSFPILSMAPLAQMDDDSNSDLTELETDDSNSEDDDLPLAEIKPMTLIPARSTFAAAPKFVNTRPSTKEVTARCLSRDKETRCVRLTPPNNTTRSTQWLHHQMHLKLIDVDPEYQRGVVWTETKQSNLINSLTENFYIPPIVFSVVRSQDPDVPDKRICIDGKQRLTSIQLFMDGYIPCTYREKNKSRQQKLWYKNLKGKRGKLMSMAQRERFDSQVIICAEYETLTPQDEREIFHRVQMGVPLSPAERLKAINGANADLIREMDHRITPELRIHLPWEKKGRDFLSLARILYIVSDNDAEPEEPTVARIETFLQTASALKYRKAVLELIDTLCHLLLDPILRRPFSHGNNKISRVEFVMACFLIHSHRKMLFLKMLSDAIKQMRSAVHPGKDGKEGRKFQASLARFVAKTVPELHKIDSEVPASKSVCGPVVLSGISMSMSPSSTDTTAGAKRKRKTTDNYDTRMGQEMVRKRSRPATRLIVDDSDSDMYEVSRPPMKAMERKKTIGNGILATVPASSTKGSAASTTIKKPTFPSKNKSSPPFSITPVVKSRSSLARSVFSERSALVPHPVKMSSINLPESEKLRQLPTATRPLSENQQQSQRLPSSTIPATPQSREPGQVPTPPPSSGCSASPVCDVDPFPRLSSETQIPSHCKSLGPLLSSRSPVVGINTEHSLSSEPLRTAEPKVNPAKRLHDVQEPRGKNRARVEDLRCSTEQAQTQLHVQGPVMPPPSSSSRTAGRTKFPLSSSTPAVPQYPIQEETPVNVDRSGTAFQRSSCSQSSMSNANMSEQNHHSLLHRPENRGTSGNYLSTRSADGPCSTFSPPYFQRKSLLQRIENWEQEAPASSASLRIDTGTGRGSQ